MSNLRHRDIMMFEVFNLNILSGNTKAQKVRLASILAQQMSVISGVELRFKIIPKSKKNPTGMLGRFYKP